MVCQTTPVFTVELSIIIIGPQGSTFVVSNAFCVMFVMRSATQPKTTRSSSVVEIQFTVSVYFHCVKNVCRPTYNFATTKLVLLPGLGPGSKSLLPPKK